MYRFFESERLSDFSFKALLRELYLEEESSYSVHEEEGSNDYLKHTSNV